MRILELKLDAFGPFTQVALDLSRGRHGLHVIYGPNEAGKTSALRAIGQLFYGIPLRSSDNFLHDFKNLRLRGLLEHSDGTQLDFVRLKRNKNPLLEADGVTALDTARLQRFLGGVDEGLFRTLFGIDHETLVKGGQAIVEGGGSLGGALFAASSGISGFKGLQQTLQDSAEELFKPMGKLQRIPAAIAELREARVKLKELQLPGEVWARHERALREARQKQAELQARRREREAAASRLRRIRSALPLFSERTQILDELEQHRDAVLLPDGFADRRRGAQQRRDAAALELRRASQAIAELEDRRGAIALPRALLDAEPDIEALRNARAAQRKAQDDRPGLERFVQEKEHAARDILQTLGKPRDLAAAEPLRLRVDEPTRISQLAHQFTELSTRRDAARSTALRHGDRLAKHRQAREALGPPANLSQLRAAISGAQKDGNLDDQAARVESQEAPLRRDLAAALRRLPGWDRERPIDDLERLVVPLPETIARSEAEAGAAEAALCELARARAREEAAVGDLEAKLRGLALERDVPGEDDLNEARAQRDADWERLRAAWAGGAAPAGGPSPGALAGWFEKSLRRADELADRLRREAQSVAAKAEWSAQLQKHRGACEKLEAQRVEAAATLERLRAEWQALLAAAGVPAMPSADLRGWIAQREKVLALHRQASDLELERSRLGQLIEGHARRLSAALAALGNHPAGLPGELAPLLDLAREVIDENEKLARRAATLDVKIGEEQEALDAARLQEASTEAALNDWRVQWGEAMGRIGRDADATPEQADVVLREIDTLFDLIKEAAGFRSRIRGIDRDAETFAKDARALAGRVAPELAEAGPEAIADQLATRLRTTRDDLQKHEALSDQLRAEAQALEKARAEHDAAALELEACCRDAGCPSEAELPAAEHRSAQRARLDADLRRCEGQIRMQSAGASVEDFAREAAGHDPDGLAGTIEALDAELEQFQHELATVAQTIGSEATVLDQMDGSSEAAEANESIGFALAQLVEDVPRYAVLKLASKVLQRGIERYRERNQGPVLARASEHFAALTLGSFAGLRIDADDRDEPVLVGVRPDGKHLGVEGMSAGSCDQLYLAIRIAYLEHWLADREPIPFIVDDILHSFDDDRAMAALRVLGDLSRRTQVIFFTHHAHLLELARACLPGDVLFPQSLPTGVAL